MPRFAVASVVTSDMAKALDFYRRLGLEFPDGAESEGHVDATNAKDVRFMIDTVDVIKSFDPEWQPPSGDLGGLAFECESSVEVDRVHGELVAAGYRSHKDPWDAFWGQRYAQVRDPDGRIVDLFAYLEGGG